MKRRLSRNSVHLLIISLIVCCPAILFAAERITPEEAINHIGKVATVCGHVVSTHYATRSRRQPTFLNLNRPYPNHVFTVLIWGKDRPKFSSAPEIYFRNKRICVTGNIERYKGIPEIIVSDPYQIILK
jgi:hypothetical protein